MDKNWFEEAQLILYGKVIVPEEPQKIELMFNSEACDEKYFKDRYQGIFRPDKS